MPLSKDAQDQLTARNVEMVQLRKEGLSLEAIGRWMPRNGRPLTKEGVRLALLRAAAQGCEAPKVHGRSLDRVNAHIFRHDRRQAEARRLFAEGFTVASIVAELGIGTLTVQGYLLPLPAYRDMTRAKLRAPRKSMLSVNEMVSLKRDGMNARTIATKAGITLGRVNQALNETGCYSPRPDTARRIGEAAELFASGLRASQVAERMSISVHSAQRYRQLAAGNPKLVEERCCR